MVPLFEGSNPSTPAMILAADAETILIITGTGDVIEPDDGMTGGPGSLSLADRNAFANQLDRSLTAALRDSNG